MCESLRPGMTVLRRPSITCVCGPRRRRISTSFPQRLSSGRYGDGFNKRGHPVRGDLGVVQYDSADKVISLSGFPNGLRRAESPPPVEFLLVNCDCSGNRILGKFRGRRAVAPSVYTYSTRSRRLVVVLTMSPLPHRRCLCCPIALALQHGGK